MSEREKQIVEKLKDAIPKMSVKVLTAITPVIEAFRSKSTYGKG